MNKKLAIIVPYRDREEHLGRFVPHMDKFLSDKEIDYKIFVVEQGNEKPFNRGWLLNIGYKIASEQGYDYFCFHDVDMLPEDNTCDYSWVDRPTHIAARLSKFKYRLVYPEYFSGVTIFNKEHFEWINGYSNKYWGWGFEDDDLLYRCRKKGVPLAEQYTVSSKDKTPRYSNVMEFHGDDYLEIKNTVSLNKVLNSSFSVEAWVEPSEDIELATKAFLAKGGEIEKYSQAANNAHRVVFRAHVEPDSRLGMGSLVDDSWDCWENKDYETNPGGSVS